MKLICKNYLYVKQIQKTVLLKLLRVLNSFWNFENVKKENHQICKDFKNNEELKNLSSNLNNVFKLFKFWTKCLKFWSKPLKIQKQNLIKTKFLKIWTRLSESQIIFQKPQSNEGQKVCLFVKSVTSLIQ